MKEVFVRGTSPRAHCLRSTPQPPPPPLYCPGLGTHRSRAAAQAPAGSASIGITAAGEISLRRAENEGLERTEEEAYVLITNGLSVGRKGRVHVWNHLVFNDCNFPSKYGVQPRLALIKYNIPYYYNIKYFNFLCPKTLL